MKKIILTTSFIILSICLFAQSENKSMIYSIGVNGLLPINNVSISYVRVGATAQAEYKLTHSIGLTAAAGVYIFPARQDVYVDFALYSSQKITWLQIPVLAGAKFYLNKNIYASGQFGASFFNQTYLTTAFTYAPGVGTRIGKKFDAMLRYISVPKYEKTFSNFDLRFAYNF